MITEWLSEAEITILHWYRSLNQWQRSAVNLWLTTGDASQIAAAFILRRRPTAA